MAKLYSRKQSATIASVGGCLILLCNSIQAQEHQQMFECNNSIRKILNLQQHNISKHLNQSAQDHAEYMAKMHDSKTEDFNHKGGNGTPGQRAAKYGYSGIVIENIARKYENPYTTFNAWVGSKLHWEAIKNPNTTQVGFGYAIANDGTKYWVTVYGITN